MVGKVLDLAFNDVSPVKIDGKIIKSYDCWTDMLNRCYSTRIQIAQPRYVGCSVAEEWLLFSNFKLWFDSRYRPGYELDKDLLAPGNRIYSPDTCVLIPTALNLFTTGRPSKGANTLQGVTRRSANSYRARIGGKKNYEVIGNFRTEKEAHLAWFNRKIELAYQYKELCDSIDPRLFEGVLRKIHSMKEV